MAGISDIVNVTITANSRTPTRAGFGTPLLMGFHTEFAELYRVYTDLSGMTDDGFASYHPVYRMAQSLLSQNPRVERFVVGRLPSAHAQSQVMTITSAVEGEHVRFTVVRPSDGTEVDVDYTILAAASTTSVATAVELLIEAITGVNASSSGADITVVPATNGDLVFFHSLENATIKDNTPDANIDDALTALQAVYDDWYLVLLDTNSEANVDLVAAWAETRTKLFIGQTQNTEEKAGTGTFLSQLETSAYDRTAMVFSDELQDYPACAWAGAVLPFDPGSITWAFKELVGVTPTTLTATQETNLDGVNANHYTTLAGLNIVRRGMAVSGEFMDIIHGTDWLKAQIQERILAIIVNAGKVPYTDASVDRFVGELLAILGLAVERGLLRAGTITASGPRVADVTVADRAARLLPDLKFSGEYAGAVHKVEVTGTLSF